MSPDGSPQEQESWNKRFEMSLAEICMELPACHRARKDYEALIADPRGMMVEMSARLDGLEDDVRELELKAPNLMQEKPTEKPLSLIRAVEAYLDWVSDSSRGSVSDDGCREREAMRLALVREKKRQELVDAVIQAARVQMQQLLEPGAMDVPCGCPTCGAIDALDTFDKGGE